MTLDERDPRPHASTRHGEGRSRVMRRGLILLGLIALATLTDSTGAGSAARPSKTPRGKGDPFPVSEILGPPSARFT
jgi:hypothetical protein